MAVIFPGWLENAGTVHTAAQLRSYLGTMLRVPNGTFIPTGGVHPTIANKLVVAQTVTPSMAVTVASGAAVIPGTEATVQGAYWAINDAEVTLPITTAHASLPRIDIVQIRVRDSFYSGVNNDALLDVKAGIPAASPVVPTPDQNTIVLAQVAVGAGVTSITDANITDTRTYLRPDGPEMVVYTSSGTFVKANYPWASRVKVRVQAGGGGGGGAGASGATTTSCGSGGGGGGYAEKWIDISALAASETVTVGLGGAGGVDTGGTGGNGGTSSFGAHCSAGGGNGGEGSSAGSNQSHFNSGAGGVGVGGDLNVRADDGGSSSRGNGFNFSLGWGGGSPLSGTRHSDAADLGAVGFTGNLRGGGGSGGHNSTNQATGKVGGDGAPGVVIVEVY